MPVTFAPPQPVSTPIAAGYGATSQWNATFPHLASLAEAYGANQQRAAIASAQQDTQASAQTAENQTRGNLATAQNESHAQNLQAQFQQQQYLQAQQIQAHERSKVFDWAVHSDQVGQQEMMRMQRQQAGLAQLAEDVAAGRITEDEAADAAYELRTNVDRTNGRVKAMHAREFEAQAAQKAQVVKQETENAAHAQKFMLDAAKMGHTMTVMTDPTSGKMHMVAIDQKTGKIYNPFLEHADKGGAAPEEKAYELDVKHYEAADKRWQYDSDHWAKHYADEMKRVEKVHADRGDKDPSADTLNSEVQDNLKARGIAPPGPRPSMPNRPGTNPTPGAPQGQPEAAAQGTGEGQTPPKAAGSPPSDALQAAIQMIQGRPLNHEASDRAVRAATRYYELRAKPNPTPQEVAEARQLHEFLSPLLR